MSDKPTIDGYYWVTYYGHRQIVKVDGMAFKPFNGLTGLTSDSEFHSWVGPLVPSDVTVYVTH